MQPQHRPRDVGVLAFDLPPRDRWVAGAALVASLTSHPGRIQVGQEVH